MADGPAVVVYSSMMADLFHYGHLQSLLRAREQGDYHICGVLTDEAARDWWGGVVSTFEERKTVLEHIDCVDEVWPQRDIVATDNLVRLRDRFPDAKIIVVKEHPEWMHEHEFELMEKYDIEYRQSAYYDRLSRERIIEHLTRIRERNGTMIRKRLKQDTLRSVLGKDITKANTLRRLKPVLKRSRIEDLFLFTVEEWYDKRPLVIDRIAQQFDGRVVLRSSSTSEDTIETSNAGLFESVLDVDPKDPASIERAIKTVIESYEKHGLSRGEQILVQEQTTDIRCSGVLFTRNLASNLPYYVINYDAHTQSTDTVTSGLESARIDILRDARAIPAEWSGLIAAVREIEDILKGVALDIEFAITKEDEVVIFQVRPLAASVKFESGDDESVFSKVREFKEQYSEFVSSGSMYDQPVYLSDMAFWNPAEIIGDGSNYLDYSLYNHLILNESWIEGIAPLGYSRTPSRLAEHFGHKTYINVLYSFLALTPADLDDDLKEKLITFYNETLRDNPHLHDKIEFEIVLNCFHFDIDARLERVPSLTPDERVSIRRSLLELTKRTIRSYEDLIEQDKGALDRMAERRSKTPVSWREKLIAFVDLIEDCCQLGTPQFSRMARLGFIASILLKSLVSRGLVDQKAIDAFMLSIPTVASELNDDFERVIAGSLPKDVFLERYGHLRPGTYDITKLPYGKNPGYFEGQTRSGSKPSAFDDAGLLETLDQVCQSEGFGCDADTISAFIRDATQARESFKFEFTKNISLALELLAEAGSELGFSRSQLAHLDYHTIRTATDPSMSKRDVVEVWSRLIESRSTESILVRKLPFPSLVFSSEDFEVIRSYLPRPNFITTKKVSAPIILLDKYATDDLPDLSGRIIAIEKADPGYDWIFTKNIAGLVTRYGGVASHMAIRCAEFDLPAAIGCADLFHKLVDGSKVVLDCENKVIR
ncbi:MAG: PEP-utilizing enzyme [Candidatus Woesearchaeota archaeon]